EGVGGGLVGGGLVLGVAALAHLLDAELVEHVLVVVVVGGDEVGPLARPLAQRRGGRQQGEGKRHRGGRPKDVPCESALQHGYLLGRVPPGRTREGRRGG